jgi:hypothetical protein
VTSTDFVLMWIRSMDNGRKLGGGAARCGVREESEVVTHRREAGGEHGQARRYKPGAKSGVGESLWLTERRLGSSPPRSG